MSLRLALNVFLKFEMMTLPFLKIYMRYLRGNMRHRSLRDRGHCPCNSHCPIVSMMLNAFLNLSHSGTVSGNPFELSFLCVLDLTH